MTEKKHLPAEKPRVFPPAVVTCARKRVANILCKASLSRFECTHEADVFATFVWPADGILYIIEYSELSEHFVGSNAASDEAAAERRAAVFAFGQNLCEWSRNRARDALQSEEAHLERVLWGGEADRIMGATFKRSSGGSASWVHLRVPGEE